VQAQSPGLDAGERAARFRGWYIVGASILAQTLGVGLISAYGFFVTPLAAEFGASNASLGLGLALFALMSGLISPVMGPVLDRGWVRALMLGGVALMALGCVGLSRATTLAQLGVFLVPVSAGVLLYGPLPVHVLVVNWFAARRGRALALAALGLSLAGFFVPPLTAWLLDAIGWRNALLVLGLGSAAIVAPVVALLVVHRPEDIGQVPDGRRDDSQGYSARPVVEPAPGAGELVRDRNFWILAIAFALIMAAPLLNGAFLVRHMERESISRQTAGFVLSWMAVFGVVGKLATAALADRMDKRWLAWVLVGMQLASWALLLDPPGLVSVVAATAVLGLGVGGFVAMPALFIGTWFGRAAFGLSAGLMGPVRLPITFSTVPLGGWLADRTETFAATFGLAIALAGTGALLLALLRPPAGTTTRSAPPSRRRTREWKGARSKRSRASAARRRPTRSSTW
jgi:predicted MFS family arabinose efflux permease